MCTNVFSQESDEYICASEVDGDGIMTAWDYCDSCCPGASVDSTPQIQANPANDPGNCCKYHYVIMLQFYLHLM